MSTTIVAVIISLLAELLPKIGIEVGSDQLTQAVSTILVVVSGLWIWYRRHQQGDVNVLGVKK